MPGVPECGISLGLLRHGMPVYGFIYDYGRDNLLQGGKEFGAIEGTNPVQASTELVNEKLTFCMHFPIPTTELDALHDALQTWRIRCPGSAAVGLSNVATGRLDGCLEYRSKPWDCVQVTQSAKVPEPPFIFSTNLPFRSRDSAHRWDPVHSV